MTDLTDKLERSIAIVQENQKLKHAIGLLRLQVDMLFDRMANLEAENASLRRCVESDFDLACDEPVSMFHRKQI